MQNCNDGKCKTTEKVWGIVDGKKLYRLTFSKSLSEFLAKLDPAYEVARFEFKIGRELDRDEASRSGVYALMSNKGYALRMQLSQELSNIYRDDYSRHIREVWLKRIS